MLCTGGTSKHVSCLAGCQASSTTPPGLQNVSERVHGLACQSGLGDVAPSCVQCVCPMASLNLRSGLTGHAGGKATFGNPRYWLLKWLGGREFS